MSTSHPRPTGTARDLTAYRRDILYQLHEGDPKRAELLLELLIMTDPDLPTGAAAREDVEGQLYGATSFAQSGLRDFKLRITRLLVSA